MDALLVLIPLSLLIVGLAVWVFFRMSDSGQFDDMTGPASSILLDDDSPRARAPGPAVDPRAGDAHECASDAASRGIDDAANRGTDDAANRGTNDGEKAAPSDAPR